MEKSLKSIASNYGLYLGVLLALITVLAYAINIELLTSMWLGIIILIAIVVFGIISVAKVKQAQSGFASFKQAFTSYFITVLIGLLISTFVSFLLFNVVDTDAAEVLKEKTIETTVEMMEGFNAPTDKIDETIKQIESQNQYSIGNIAKGLAGYLVFFSIIGLIVAAAMKKSNPDAE
jgi:c-di-AMP phosphodiesterase-like protein